MLSTTRLFHVSSLQFGIMMHTSLPYQNPYFLHCHLLAWRILVKEDDTGIYMEFSGMISLTKEKCIRYGN